VRKDEKTMVKLIFCLIDKRVLKKAYGDIPISREIPRFRLIHQLPGQEMLFRQSAF
jgi:hypothetical protein